MKRRILIISTISLTVPFITTICSCANNQAIKQDINKQKTNNVGKQINRQQSSIDNSTSVVITFQPGQDQDGVTFIGGTVIKLKKGREFATAAAPIAMKDGFSNDYWLRPDGSRVFNNDKITTNLTLYPFFSHDVKLGNCVGIAALEDSKVSIVTHGVGAKQPDLSYSDNGISWTTYDPNVKSIIDVKAGATLYFRGNNINGFSQSETIYTSFSIGGKVNINGNAMTLIDDGNGSTKNIPNDYCFYRLFESCSGIVSISSDFLPAEKLKKYCYAYMFYDCSSLTHFPSTMLPVKNLYYDETYDGTCCYTGMFMNCSGLTTIPNGLLPCGKDDTDTLSPYCYYGMFEGCTNLTSLPSNLLPSKKLAYGCYYGMFADCTKLTNIANDFLPSTTLAPNCYGSMFASCSKLTDVSNLSLPANNLAGCDECYSQMFYNCTSLVNAPKLPATTLAPSCYSAMFYNCHALTTLPDSTEDATTYFLPSTNLEGASSCYRYMFYNCTNLVNIPDLPATTLSSYCYSDMFHGCTSLTKSSVTDLPATTLSSHCYDSMFYGCSNMDYTFSLPDGVTLADYCCDSMFAYCTSLTSTPEMKATVAAEGCYMNMFSGCTNITNPGRIYISTWASYACWMMFSECKNFAVTNSSTSHQLISLPNETTYEQDTTIVGYMFQGTKGRETAGWSPYYQDSWSGRIYYASNWYRS